MSTSVEGFFRNGRIELVETPSNVRDNTPVVVTFLEAQPVDLLALGFEAEQTAELRARLSAFAEEWDSPEMAAYDDYDATRARLQSR